MKKHLLLLSAFSFFALLLHAQQNVGIGTNNPQSKLSVSGGLGVGATYSSTTAAPANGAIIEGQVGIGTSTPDASAALDIKGNNKGVLLPSVDLSTVSWAPASGPATGLVVWNNNASFGSGVGLYYNSGTALSPLWVRVSTNANTVTAVTASSPLSSSGGNTPNISLTGVVPIANGGTNASTFSANNQFLWFDGTKIVSSGYGAASFLNSASGTNNFVPKFTGANSIGNSQVYDDATNVGVGTSAPTTKLDVNGAIALREGQTLVLANGGASGGANDNITLPDVSGSPGVKSSFYRITGPSAPFSIYGIAPVTNADGQLVTLVNTTSNVMTVKNNGSSTNANSIKTLTGADLVSVSGNSSVTLQYNKTDARWYVTATQNFVAPAGSIATKDIVPGTGSAVTVTNGAGQVVGGGNVVLDVATNGLNQKGIVPGPTGLNGNQGWITDPSGNPAWAPVNSAITKKDVTTSTSGVTLGNNTGQVVGANNMTIDVATNSAASAGLVPAGTGNPNKVYGTDGAGNPAWTPVSNAMLTNQGVTVNTGTGLSGGGTVNLGSTITLNNTGVTSVGLSLPSIFSVSGSPVTTTGTLTGSLATQAANTIFAGPASGVAATPGFRALTAADLPAGSSTYIQNQFSAAQAAANFWISGTGRVTTLNLTDGNTALTQGSGSALRITTPYGYTEIGPQNSTWSHFITDRAQYYFNKRITVDEGIVSSYAQDLQLQTSGTTRMWLNNSTGNVGVGVSPSARFHVAGGGAIIGTNGTSSNTRTLTLLADGTSQTNFGSYPGQWTSALQIQDNTTNRFLWLSPLDNASGANSRLVAAGTGFDIYTNGSAGSAGSLAATFAANTNVTLPSLSAGGLVKSSGGTLAIAGSGDIPAGSGNYIQNQNSGSQSANFNISGLGYAANYFQSPTVYVNNYRHTASTYENLFSDNNSSGGFHFYRNDGNSWGYMYADNGGIGILKDGSWAIRATGGVNGTNSDVSWFTDGGSIRGYINSSGLALYGALTTVSGNTPSNYAMRCTPNLHLNAGSGYAIIANWDNGSVGGGTQELRVGNGAGTDEFYVRADGAHFGRIFYDLDNSGNYVDPNGNTYINAFQTNNTLAGWPGYNGLTQAYGHYIWPGRNDGSGAWWNQSWYLASHSSYGLYINTGLDINGGLYSGGNLAIDNGAGWHRSYGQTGWYNGSYGGGMWMQDGTWVRVYNGKSFLAQSSVGSPAIRGDQQYSSGYYGMEIYPYGQVTGYPGIYTNGYMYAYNYYYVSTREKKKDIEDFKKEDYASALAFMDKLDLHYYKYKEEDEYYHKVHIGLIAEETPTTLTAPGKTGVSYGELAIFNTGAIKSLKDKVEAIEKAQENISDFGMENVATHQQFVAFSDAFKAKLGQAAAIVTVTPSTPGADVIVTNVTAEGFTAETNASSGNVAFSWMAMAKVTKSDADVSAKMNDKFSNMLQSAENDTRPIPKLSTTPAEQVGHPAEEALEKQKVVPGNPVNPNTPNGPIVDQEYVKRANLKSDAEMTPDEAIKKTASQKAPMTGKTEISPK